MEDSPVWEVPPVSEDDRTDEIKRLTTPEGVQGLDRALFLLSGDHFQQKRALVASLPALAVAYGHSVFSCLLQPLAAQLLNFDIELQVAFASSVAAIAASGGLKGVPSAADWIIQLVLEHIKHRHTPEEVLKAWLHTFSAVLPNVSQRRLQDALALADAGATHGSTAHVRAVSGVLLCEIAKALQGIDEGDQVLCRIRQLCQDTDYPVRVCLAGQLPRLADALKLPNDIHMILSEVILLVEDEEVTVRKAAIASLADLQARVSSEAQERMILPILRRLLEQAAMDVNLAVSLGLENSLVTLYGQAPATALGVTDAEAFLTCFTGLALHSQACTRQRCAEALAGAAKTLQPFGLTVRLCSVCKELAYDSDESVRVALAANLHDVAAVLSHEDCLEHLKRPLLALLVDASALVVEALLQRFAALLQAFQGVDWVQRSQLTGELLPLLLRLEMSPCGWRCMTGLLAAVPVLLQVLNKDEVLRDMASLVLSQAVVGAVPVRRAAAQAAAAMLRASLGGRQAADLYRRLMEELAGGPSYWCRIGFLHFCEEALHAFSSRFFKRHFWQACVDLADDRVVGVRMAVASLLPSLRGCLVLPADQSLLLSLDAAIAALAQSPDPHVAAAATASCAASQDPATQCEGAQDARKEAEDGEADLTLGRSHNRDKGTDRHIFKGGHMVGHRQPADAVRRPARTASYDPKSATASPSGRAAQPKAPAQIGGGAAPRPTQDPSQVPKPVGGTKVVSPVARAPSVPSSAHSARDAAISRAGSVPKLAILRGPDIPSNTQLPQLSSSPTLAGSAQPQQPPKQTPGSLSLTASSTATGGGAADRAEGTIQPRKISVSLLNGLKLPGADRLGIKERPAGELAAALLPTAAGNDGGAKEREEDKGRGRSGSMTPRPRGSSFFERLLEEASANAGDPASPRGSCSPRGGSPMAAPACKIASRLMSPRVSACGGVMSPRVSASGEISSKVEASRLMSPRVSISGGVSSKTAASRLMLPRVSTSGVVSSKMEERISIAGQRAEDKLHPTLAQRVSPVPSDMQQLRAAEGPPLRLVHLSKLTKSSSVQPPLQQESQRLHESEAIRPVLSSAVKNAGHAVNFSAGPLTGQATRHGIAPSMTQQYAGLNKAASVPPDNRPKMHMPVMKPKKAP